MACRNSLLQFTCNPIKRVYLFSFHKDIFLQVLESDYNQII